MSRPAVVYAYRGREITASEAAKELGVSLQTITNRLKKFGGDMERVMDAPKRERRADKMKKLTERDEKAAQDIMAAICGEDADAPERPGDRLDALRRYNDAIDALSALGGTVSAKAELCKQAIELECALRATRSIEFEALVDWAAIARG